MVGSNNEDLKGPLFRAIDAYLSKGMLDELQEDMSLHLYDMNDRSIGRMKMYQQAAKRFACSDIKGVK